MLLWCFQGDRCAQNRLAAEQGYALAQYNLGVKYAQGRGVPANYSIAHMWLNIAASLGFKNAGKARNIVEKGMTPTQVETAQRLAREWVTKNKK